MKSHSRISLWWEVVLVVQKLSAAAAASIRMIQEAETKTLYLLIIASEWRWWSIARGVEVTQMMAALAAPWKRHPTRTSSRISWRNTLLKEIIPKSDA
jgi:hypothetical protein